MPLYWLSQGLLGLLLWPNSERARLIGKAVQPELAPST
jgi:hypothetical protein